MNKRIFTLLTAGLLLGGPAFNAAYAATDLTAKTVISYSENKTALANGMSFYLGASENELLKVTDVLTTKDKKKVISLVMLMVMQLQESYLLSVIIHLTLLSCGLMLVVWLIK